MILYSRFFNIKRITIDQKETPCTDINKKIKDVTKENEGSVPNDEDGSCDDYNMNSDNIITTKRKHTMQSME